MQIARGLDQLGKLGTKTKVSLGNFDGFHLGHQEILSELIRRSRLERSEAVVATFDPHPRKVLNSGNAFKLLISMEHRLKLMEGLGVDRVLIFQFDLEFSKIPPESFIRSILFPALKFSELIVGRNYTFGNERKGDIRLLSSLSRELGFELHDVAPVKMESGEPVSSSLLRRWVAQGELSKVSQWMGRPYSILGSVIRGRGIGAQLGYPTANLDVHELVLPPRGVYAVEAECFGARRLGLANIGIRPTFGLREGDGESLEIHLLDFDREIYGASMEVFFMEKIRSELRFASPEALRGQIRSDAEHVRSKFLRA